MRKLIIAAILLLCAVPAQAVPPIYPGQTVIPRAPGTYTQTTVALSAGTSTVLLAANSTRKSIQAILRTSTSADICFTASAATCVAGTGYPLPWQWVSTPIYDGAGVSTDAWTAICTLACSITVIEGN